MNALRIYKLVVIFIFCGLHAFSQQKLEISYTRFGLLKKYEVATNEKLSYKLKGEHKYTTDRIFALHDSTISLDNDSITFKQLKSIRFKNNNYHGKLFQRLFLIGGIGYPALNVINDGRTGITPILSEKAMIVSGSFLAASLILYELSVKRIKITKNKALRVFDPGDFQHLNGK